MKIIFSDSEQKHEYEITDREFYEKLYQDFLEELDKHRKTLSL